MRAISIAVAVCATAVATVLATPAFACASCGCTLTSDWLSQGLVVQPGTTASLRYDYVPQTELRTGDREVTDAEKALPADREIEKYTYNHYVTASLDRQFDADWGVNVQAPFVYRPHETFAEGDTDPSFSHTQGIGDIRITARWQGLKTPGCITGVQFGLVVPTGAIHQTFRSGPQQGGEVDRGLQPGTGTVQALLGFYVYGKLAKDFDYIVQVQGQTALDDRDFYKPGSSAQFSFGLHYAHWRGITPQLELTARASARDSGVNSDHENSGGEQINLSPGIVATLTSRVSAYAYVQLPLYEHVNGFQLTPHFTTSVGLQARL
jgi:hypothetical protein